MSPTFPLEVVEHVIDQAGDDIPTLRSLSLTCHHLLPRSRYHLFSTVGFKNRTELHGLCDFLASKPRLRSLVHFVVVRAVPGLPHPLTLLEVIPVPLLSLLPNLWGWTLSTDGLEREALKWSSFSTRTLACLRHYSSTVCTLRLSSVHFRTCSELAWLVVAFRGLLDLYCTDIHFEREGDITERLKKRLSSQLSLNRLSLYDVQRYATSLFTSYSCSSLRELGLDIASGPTDILLTYPPAFVRLEHLILSIAHANTPQGNLHRSFFAVRSALASIDSVTLKHVVMRIDYSCTPSKDNSKVLSECRELDQLLLGRKLETVVIAVVNARRHRGNMQSIACKYKDLFPALYKRGIISVIPEVDSRTASHDSAVTALAVSPDNRFVASSSETTIIIWDAQTHRSLREWPVDGATQGINILTFSRLHHLASCGGKHGHISLWDSMEGRLLAVFKGRIEFPRDRWPPNITLLSSTTGCFVDRVGAPVSLPGGPSVVSSFEVFGRLLDAKAMSLSVSLSDGSRFASVSTSCNPTGRIEACMWSPNGARLASLTEEGGVCVWDAETYKGLHVLHSYEAFDHIRCVLFSPNGQWIVAGSAGGRIHVWDVATGAQLAAVSHGHSAIHSMAYHPDGERIAIWTSGPNGLREVRVLNVNLEVNTQRPQEVILPEGRMDSRMFTGHLKTIAFSRDGRLLLWAIWNHCDNNGVLVKVWDTRTKRVLRQRYGFTKGSESVHTVSFSPDGKHIAIAASRKGEVRVWRIQNNKAPVEIFTEHGVRDVDCWGTCVAYSLDGAILASGALDGSAFIRRIPGIPTLP